MTQLWILNTEYWIINKEEISSAFSNLLTCEPQESFLGKYSIDWRHVYKMLAFLHVAWRLKTPSLLFVPEISRQIPYTHTLAQVDNSAWTLVLGLQDSPFSSYENFSQVTEKTKKNKITHTHTHLHFRPFCLV